MKKIMKSEGNDRRGQAILFVLLILFLLAGSIISMYYLRRMESPEIVTAKINDDQQTDLSRTYSSNRYYHEVLMY